MILLNIISPSSPPLSHCPSSPLASLYPPFPLLPFCLDPAELPSQCVVLRGHQNHMHLHPPAWDAAKDHFQKALMHKHTDPHREKRFMKSSFGVFNPSIQLLFTSQTYPPDLWWYSLQLLQRFSALSHTLYPSQGFIKLINKVSYPPPVVFIVTKPPAKLLSTRWRWNSLQSIPVCL